jgi:lipopolysaccharide transport system permease protein
MPLSKIFSGLIKFSIQFTLFLITLVYYYFNGTAVHPDLLGIIIMTPIILFIMAGIGLGMGLILSSLTTKYRDLSFLISFGIQLAMYATPVIFPMSVISAKYKFLIEINPMAWLVEAFRKVYLGSGYFSWYGLLYSFGFMTVLLVIGTIIFNRVEKTFMDTV